jgi:hypothetical protein
MLFGVLLSAQETQYESWNEQYWAPALIEYKTNRFSPASGNPRKAADMWIPLRSRVAPGFNFVWHRGHTERWHLNSHIPSSGARACNNFVWAPTFWSVATGRGTPRKWRSLKTTFLTTCSVTSQPQTSWIFALMKGVASDSGTNDNTSHIQEKASGGSDPRHSEKDKSRMLAIAHKQAVYKLGAPTRAQPCQHATHVQSSFMWRKAFLFFISIACFDYAFMNCTRAIQLFILVSEGNFQLPGSVSILEAHIQMQIPDSQIPANLLPRYLLPTYLPTHIIYLQSIFLATLQPDCRTFLQPPLHFTFQATLHILSIVLISPSLHSHLFSVAWMITCAVQWET